MTEPMSDERLADSRAYFEYRKANSEVARRALEVLAEVDRLREVVKTRDQLLAMQGKELKRLDEARIEAERLNCQMLGIQEKIIWQPRYNEQEVTDARR